MAPLVTPFKKNGDVDIEAYTAQVVRCASAGMGIGTFFSRSSIFPLQSPALEGFQPSSSFHPHLALLEVSGLLPDVLPAYLACMSTLNRLSIELVRICRLTRFPPSPSPPLVISGTNGEASHLDAEERVAIISASRAALDKAGLEATPLLVGTGGNSARETIKLSKEAKDAGADFAIVITPGYFAFVMGKDRKAIADFFIEVADKSPLPIMIVSSLGLLPLSARSRSRCPPRMASS